MEGLAFSKGNVEHTGVLIEELSIFFLRLSTCLK
jgi:hypothetical protein